MKKHIFEYAKIITLVAILVGGASYLRAWTGPTLSPPNGNVSAPINVSSSTQTKLGSLILNAATPIQNAIGLTVFGNTILNGGVIIANGTQGSGKVLQSASDGTATWVATTSLGVSAVASSTKFGVWNDINNDGVADTVSGNTTYHAVTDGTVVGYALCGNCNLSFTANTGSTTPPSTTVISAGGVTAVTVPFTFPVKKGDYWSTAIGAGDGAAIVVRWLPQN